MKKITALILCAIIAFSALTCIVSAQDEDDYDDIYITSTTITTEPNTEVESLIEEFFGDNLRDKTDEALGFIEMMRSILEQIVNFFQSMLDYLASLANS